MNCFWKSLMLGLASATFVACSSDELQGNVSVTPEDAQPKITLKVATPRAGSLIVEGGARAAIHTNDEWEVKTLNVYIFKKGADGSYTFYSKTPFTTGGVDQLMAGSSDATYTCTLTIDPDLFEQNVQILLLANEDGTVDCQKDVTALVDFKATLANATVTDGANANALVNYGADGTQYGFAMSGQAVDANSDTEYELSSSGIEVSAELTRNVARIDIENKTPNLTITGVSMHNTVDKSYLFAQDTYAAPADVTSIGLLPVETYYADGSFSNLEYADGGDNVYEQMLYIYEQAAALQDKDCPYVTIDYRLTFDDNTYADHSIKVYFKGTDGAYKDVKRNHRYTIVLGDGNEIDGGMALKTEVKDYEDGEDFELEF